MLREVLGSRMFMRSLQSDPSEGSDDTHFQLKHSGGLACCHQGVVYLESQTSQKCLHGRGLYPNSIPEGVAIVDWDGDGDLDVATQPRQLPEPQKYLE